jgi:DNA mismatch repair protein MutS
MEPAPSNLTPMIRQYLEIKKNYQDSILFFRMGDFYEMFFEDALKASPILEIALTSRNKGNENAIPFCGVPHHSASSYIARLIQAGHKVAICEQMEDPQTAKGIVKREVIRVITPGLVLESESLDAKVNNYLASLSIHHENYALGFVDISTGEMAIGIFHEMGSLLSELNRREPRQILVSSKDRDHPLFSKIRQQFPQCFVEVFDLSPSPQPSPVEGEGAKEKSPPSSPSPRAGEGWGEGEYRGLLSTFSERFQKSWEIASLKNTFPLAERAALRLLGYIHETLKTEVGHLNTLRWTTEGAHLVLDAATVRNLELVRNLHDGRTWGTLLDVLDKTKTSMGARRLKNWILYPLASEAEIKIRQQAIGELIERAEVLIKIREHLAQIADLERQNGRIATGIANARDLSSVGHSLEQLPFLRMELEKLNSPFVKNLFQGWNDLQFLTSKILSTLKEELPLSIREGGLIRDGVIPELDELRSILHDGKSVLARMEEEERKKTGITSLKVRYNRVFGYYIEIPHTRRDLVPSHYQRKQTLVNAERYITPELKSYEEKVLGAEERIRHLEFEYFSNLRTEVAREASEISQIAQRVADLDVMGSLSRVAQENNYCCPEFTGGEELIIEEGRHPVLEKLFPASRFVPNDASLNTMDCRLILLTGPNMAGKSTILRQTAIIALMAHIGSYVPAKKVRLGLIDRIFTRIGASDNLAKNQSTFWVEMEETANILKSATQKSLVILDEIGRGTSTYDGLSIAWAVTEHFHDQVKAKTLFATHYHELIQLAEVKGGIKNFHIAVKEWNDQILFLYQMVPGGISQSYGIQVASLAGIPDSVIRRSREILNELQEKNPPSPSRGEGEILSPSPWTGEGRGEGDSNKQLPLFTSSEAMILQQIKDLPLDQLTPLEALQRLYEFKKKI